MDKNKQEELGLTLSIERGVLNICIGDIIMSI